MDILIPYYPAHLTMETISPGIPEWRRKQKFLTHLTEKKTFLAYLTNGTISPSWHTWQWKEHFLTYLTMEATFPEIPDNGSNKVTFPIIPDNGSNISKHTWQLKQYLQEWADQKVTVSTCDHGKPAQSKVIEIRRIIDLWFVIIVIILPRGTPAPSSYPSHPKKFRP